MKTGHGGTRMLLCRVLYLSALTVVTVIRDVDEGGAGALAVWLN